MSHFCFRRIAAAFIDVEAEASQYEEDDFTGDEESQCDDPADLFEADFINDTTPARSSQAPRR